MNRAGRRNRARGTGPAAAMPPRMAAYRPGDKP